MRKRQLGYLVAAFVMLIFIGGCTSRGTEMDHSMSVAQEEEVRMSITPEAVETAEEETQSIDNKVQSIEGWEEIPSNFEDFSHESIVFDADIFVPEEFSTGTGYTWTCRKIVFQDDIKSVFNINDEEIANYNEIELNDNLLGKYTDKWFELKNGATFCYGGYCLEYNTPLFYYITNCIRKDIRLESYNLDKYPEKTDLDFMPYQEAAKEVMDFLRDLGILVSDDYNCYALDAETLRQQEDCRDTTGIWQKENQKEAWSQEDECYYFEFKQKVNNVMISQTGYGSTSDGIGNSDSATQVYYSKDGLVSLWVKHVYEVEQEKQKVELLSAEKLENTLIENQEMLIGANKKTIEKMELVYLPMIVGMNQMELIPVWEVTQNVEYAELGVTDLQTVHINAENGQEIL